MSGPIDGVAYTLPNITLLEYATGLIMDSPPLSAGDFKLYRDGVLDGNLDTMPTASGVAVTVQLSSAETTGVASVLIVAHDPDGIWGDWSWSSLVESLSVEAALAAIQAKTDALPNDPADASDVAAAVGAVLTAVGLLNNLSSAQAQAATAAALTAYSVATAAQAAAAGTLTAGERTAIADAVRMRQLSESYAADGVVPTLEQALFMMLQTLTEFGIVGTALTTRRLDKSTTAMVHTLDDADAPTSRTRST